MNRVLMAIFLSAVFVGGVLPTDAYSQIRETGKPAMVQQCQKNFDAMDSNGDGVVTKEEFLSFEHKGRNAEEVFKSKDSDGDGRLTKEEFCAAKGAGGQGK